jgi:excinuclease ABC subunit A
VIQIKGAQEHNLRNVDVTLPRDRLVVLTGVSGSGKSSLAFDTIYKEGQRRYVESLSAYARQFIGQAEKPRVDHIEGLSPTVAITQKTTNRNPRSTVGTITEIYDYLRVLFARVGTPHCPKCGTVIQAQAPDEIVAQIVQRSQQQDVIVLAPVIRGRKGEYRAELEALRSSGYARAKIDGRIQRLDEPVELDRKRKHSIAAVVDRLHVDAESQGRLTEAVEAALKLGKGLVSVELDGEEVLFSSLLSCLTCGLAVPELEPRSFSFNTPQGCCPACKGLGKQTEVDLRLLLPDPSKSLRQGCLATTGEDGSISYSRLSLQQWEQLAAAVGFSLDTPWQELAEEHQRFILHGSRSRKFQLDWAWESGDGRTRASGRREQRFEGILPLMMAAHGGAHAAHIDPYLTMQPCSACQGRRLRPETLAVTIDQRSIADVAALSTADAARWIDSLNADCLSRNQLTIARQVLREIGMRLSFLVNVGLEYLTLDRTADTLAGGEAQRIRLATQVGSGLQGVTYVLDEPSIGLHQRDNQRLLRTLHELRDRGNSVLVVEHDEETMHGADWIVDFGPGSGREGGNIIATGTAAEVARVTQSPTGRYLAGTLRIPIPESRRPGNGQFLSVIDANEHNLQRVSVRFPLGCFIGITGVSGSGKSTLIDDILKKALARELHGAQIKPGAFARIDGIAHLDKVIEIDQSPIGRTPRSNPATYAGAFDYIRDLFAKLPESRVRGYKPGRFSFNVKGGRCEACAGDGTRRIEMQFLADVEVPCEVCAGRRFNQETLGITYKGKNIADVLDMRIDEALPFFEHIPPLQRILQRLVDVGLGYMQVGQSSTTLSGGEAQRVKLASELGRPATGRTLYILDEPTTGLHVADIQKLLLVLQRLVDTGNTVIVIEHHPDVIKVADWLIDLGPEGGRGGGRVVAEGTPEAVAAVTASYTGQMLLNIFAKEREHRTQVLPSVDSNGAVQAHLAMHHATNGKVFSPSVNGLSKHQHGVSESAFPYRDGGWEFGSPEFIRIEGARKHNLRHISVDIPKEKMTVVTGVSGSGKSSLALDTLFAEGQRRFVECLSAYARQFLGRMDAADVDRMEGLAPAIAIDQHHSSRSPRSNVATQTELYDYFRLLWARCGQPHCPNCGVPLSALTSSQIVDMLLDAPPTPVTILAPLTLAAPEQAVDLIAGLQREGFRRLRLDGEVRELEAAAAAAGAQHLELVIDRMTADADSRGRLADAIELALAKGQGEVLVEGPSGDTRRFSQMPACSSCGFKLEAEITPRDFSFNSYTGACPRCHGLGNVKGLDPALLIPDPRCSYNGGGIASAQGGWLERNQWRHAVLASLAKHYGFSLNTPLGQLTAEQRDLLLYGTKGERFPVHLRRTGRTSRVEVDREEDWEGFIPKQMRWYVEDPARYAWLERFMSEGVCPDCGGERLKPVPRAVTVGGMSLPEVCRLSVLPARAFFSDLTFPPHLAPVAEQPLKEITERLSFLADVGLGYLTLDRSSATLSGGEAQRVRLATQIGSKLVGVLYVLDEPSVGLHPRDIDRLLASLRALRDLGNTLVLVEHDATTMRAADYLVDLGPGAGTEGGLVIAQGTYAEVARHPGSLTGRYLRGELESVPSRHRGAAATALTVRGAAANNLKGIDVRFPLGRLIAVTGVSGSGKSTLVGQILARSLTRAVGRAADEPGTHRALEGIGEVSNVVVIDQAPIGRSPRSNPATYTGLFDSIRDFFANLPESRVRGFTRARFSFNDRQGMCPACKGDGVKAVEMHFLADVEVPCEVCDGRRYNAQTLQVAYKGRTIADVLDLTVREGREFFQHLPKATAILKVLDEVGLGYLRLGQPVSTLSRGETQRLKLAADLCRPDSGRTVYILDEPTTGLHAADVQKLLALLQQLVDRGNTVIVIEHHMDVVKVADHVIDLGPEGGDGGGYLVAAGSPDEVARQDQSFTARYLQEALRGELVLV